MTAKHEDARAQDEDLRLHLLSQLEKVQSRLRAASTAPTTAGAAAQYAPAVSAAAVAAGLTAAATIVQAATVSKAGSATTTRRPGDTTTPLLVDHRPSGARARAASRDREATPRRRSVDHTSGRSSLSPLGRSHPKEGKAREVLVGQRLTDEEARRESARAAAVVSRRALAPIITPDLQALLRSSDAERTARGLPAHTLNSFLLHLQEQGNLPQAAHQNEAPQDSMEQDLLTTPGRSQGAPSQGHRQEGKQ